MAAQTASSFVRFTCTGDDLDRFADPGLDQRIKLVLPVEDRDGFEGVPLELGWDGLHDLPADVRPSVRTSTTRAVRPLLREVDVAMVLHGDGGPASRFAGSAAPGDVAALLGPDAGFDGDSGGLESRAPEGTPVLLVADETAVPAAPRILEELPRDTTGEAVLEVPEHGDRLDVDGPAGVQVTWLARGGSGAPGALLQPAVVDTLARTWPQLMGGPGAGAEELPAPEGDDLLREVAATDPSTGLDAWMAGEAGAITGLRRHLVRDLGVPRGSVSFRGYWKLGRSAVG